MPRVTRDVRIQPVFRIALCLLLASSEETEPKESYDIPSIRAK